MQSTQQLVWKWIDGGVLIRLEELVPEEAWEALEVARLRRAVEDDSYRDDVLRAKGIVSACSLPFFPCNCWHRAAGFTFVPSAQEKSASSLLLLLCLWLRQFKDPRLSELAQDIALGMYPRYLCFS